MPMLPNSFMPAALASGNPAGLAGLGLTAQNPDLASQLLGFLFPGPPQSPEAFGQSIGMLGQAIQGMQGQGQQQSYGPGAPAPGLGRAPGPENVQALQALGTPQGGVAPNVPGVMNLGSLIRGA